MTIASDLGIVIGKKYRVVGPRPGCELGSNGRDMVGKIVTLDEDDETSLPFFNSDTRNKFCMNVEYTLLEEVVDAPADPVNYNVSIVDNNTTIVLQKRLSVEEVHAFLKAVGV